jgi:hypothetical protein
MPNKDPAFLLYSKDWLQGTAQMLPEEKGVYIDLLCHQHQDSGLPTNTKRLARISNMSEPDFLKIWEYLKDKFVEKDGKFFNKKLVSVVNGRIEHAEMRTIIGTFGRQLKDLNLTDEERNFVRSQFDYRDFIEEFQQNQQNLSKTISNAISIWLGGNCQLTSPNHEDGNGNEDYIISNSSVVYKMFEIFKKINLEYPEDKKRDYTSLYQIALKISKSKKIEPHEMLNGKMPDVLKSWEAVVDFIVSDKWFSTRALFDINNEWQRLIQSMTSRNKEIVSVKKSKNLYI